MQRFAILASLTAALALVSPESVHAQDVCAPGLALGAAQPVGPFDAYATLHDSTRVVSDGLSVDHVGADGQLLLHLGSYPAYVFPSFVLLAPDESFALVGESSTGGIERFELDGSPQSTVGGIAFNYDALFEDAGHVLVSADTSGTFQNQILRLDLSNGALTLVAQLSGPSGPFARRASSGELFVGLVDLTLPDHDQVLRFEASQLGSGAVLGVADAQVFASGLPNVAALRIDERYDSAGLGYWRVLLAIAPFGAPSTIACFAADGTRLADLATSPDSISNLELHSGPSAGCFAPWQPDAGETLSYRGTTFCFPNCTNAELRHIEPRRAQASIGGPGLGNPLGGSVTLALDGCVPNASAWLLLGPQGLYSTSEATRVHPDGFLWHSGLAWSPLRRLVLLPTDALGHASFTYQNPGSLNGTHAFQALVRAANGVTVGSSTSVLN
ncbi:MAG: hypothetical protein IPJ19_02070 [Planctomycetes bacterium]|nr:hypothetical protein [Planctomycetota bacterium]